MGSRKKIIANIRRHISAEYTKPELNFGAVAFPDKTEQFSEMVRIAGGDVIRLQPEEDIDRVIRSLYPDARVIASAIPGLTLSTLNPDTIESPHELNGTDLGVVQGAFGVAENGCVWIPQDIKERAVYFISEKLVILLKEEEIVDNMHEAYRKISGNDFGFGVFISGPSKTADIEQALVIGAHGAKGVTVLLT